MIARWIPIGRNLEARVYCMKCLQSKVITAVDKPQWWAVNEVPVHGFSLVRHVACDKCGFRIGHRLSREQGVEVPTP